MKPRPPRLPAAASIVVAGVVGALVLTPGKVGGDAAARAGLERGFALPAYSSDGYQSRQAALDLRQIAAVGARWVQINPTWYQDRRDSSTLGPSARTPTDVSVRRVIADAHRVGLKVFLKPLLDIAAGDDAYRGTIRPTDRTAWFAAYGIFIDHYAELAAQQQVEQFGVGTELAGMSGDRAGWLGVVASVRERYRGLLVYAANFDEYPAVAFWDAVDLIGVDAYWRLSPHPTADVAALQRAWAPIAAELAAFADRRRQRVLFTEAGYPSQYGSTTAPWSWTTSRTPDQAEQAAGYRALLSSLDGRPWWAGVFWWAWDVPQAGQDTDPLGYTPRGKAAEAVVRRWWT